MFFDFLYILACSAFSIVYIYKLVETGNVLAFLPRTFDRIFSGCYSEESKIHDLRRGLFSCPVCVSGRIALFYYYPVCIWEGIEYNPLAHISTVIFTLFITFFYVTKID